MACGGTRTSKRGRKLPVAELPCYEMGMAFRFQIVSPPPKPLSPIQTARKYGLSAADASAITRYIAREVQGGGVVEPFGRVLTTVKAKKKGRSLARRKAARARS